MPAKTIKDVLLLTAAIACAATLAWAGNPPKSGTLVSENSVPCGSQTKGKNKTLEIDCQEYLIRSDGTDYRVRQEKPSAAGLIPVNSTVEFSIDKNKMKFKTNGHSYDYLVVGEGPAGAPTAAKP